MLVLWDRIGDGASGNNVMVRSYCLVLNPFRSQLRRNKLSRSLRRGRWESDAAEGVGVTMAQCPCKLMEQGVGTDANPPSSGCHQ